MHPVLGVVALYVVLLIKSSLGCHNNWIASTSLPLFSDSSSNSLIYAQTVKLLTMDSPVQHGNWTHNDYLLLSNSSMATTPKLQPLQP